jgi:uncharacterized Zn-binding protein involved in type VI secretion
MKKTKNKIYTINRMCFFSFFFLFALSIDIGSYGSKPAARIGDATAHGGVITQGCFTVFIEGKPAARMGDMHTCPMVTITGRVAKPHVGGPIYTGSNTVFICGKRAARIGDMAVCQGPPDRIVKGSATVLIGN